MTTWWVDTLGLWGLTAMLGVLERLLCAAQCRHLVASLVALRAADGTLGMAQCPYSPCIVVCCRA